MTTAGAARLRTEIDRLAALKTHTDVSVEGKVHLKAIDRQLRYLLPRLEALESINPLQQPKDRALFAASVTVLETPANTTTWRIVGLDEVDLAKGWISWMSPLATALLEKRVGDVVPFLGRRLTILKITYEA